MRILAHYNEWTVLLLGGAAWIDSIVYAISDTGNRNHSRTKFGVLFGTLFSSYSLRMLEDLEVARLVEWALTSHMQNAQFPFQKFALIRLPTVLEQSQNIESFGEVPFQTFPEKTLDFL